MTIAEFNTELARLIKKGGESRQADAAKALRWVGRHDLPFLWIDVGLVDAAWKLDTHLWVPVGAGAY